MIIQWVAWVVWAGECRLVSDHKEMEVVDMDTT
jgi:hypothetical protein